MNTRTVLIAALLVSSAAGCSPSPGNSDPNDPAAEGGDAELPVGPFGPASVWCEAANPEREGGEFSLEVIGEGPWGEGSWALDWAYSGPPDDSPGSWLEIADGAYFLRTSEGMIETDEIGDEVGAFVSLLPGSDDDVVSLGLVFVDGELGFPDGYVDDPNPPQEVTLGFPDLQLDSSCTVTIAPNQLDGSLECAAADGVLNGVPGVWEISLTWSFDCAWMNF